MSRIDDLNMTTMEVVMTLGEGNPGAITVIVNSLKDAPIVDPTSALGNLTFLLLCDTYEIYGSRIWMLYKDVCHENYAVAHALLRACQMGIVSRSHLNNAIDNYGNGIDLPEIIKQLKEKLPDFNLLEDTETTA